MLHHLISAQVYCLCLLLLNPPYFTADLVACVREVQHAIDTALRPGYGGGLNSGSGNGINADELAQLKSIRPI
jgi:hypothetical protein